MEAEMWAASEWAHLDHLFSVAVHQCQDPPIEKSTGSSFQKYSCIQQTLYHFLLNSKDPESNNRGTLVHAGLNLRETMSSFAMAGRGPRARYYPGVNSLAIFSAQGSNPLQDCKVYGKGVARVYDKSVKGYVYSITGGLQSKLQLPKDDSKIGLQLLQPFLVLQLFVPQGVHFSMELRVSDINNTHRKMYFSTSFNEIKSTPLHCQIPIFMIIRNKWLSLAFHVADLFNNCFGGGGGMSFRSIDVIVLGPICKLRKIFTMRCRIIETDPKGYLEESSEAAIENSLPQEHSYALGVDSCVQTFDMMSLRAAMSSNNEAHHDHDSRPGLQFDLSARKQNQPGRSMENIKSVHVAFGTRMPLPLSTIQINTNTNLPHDKSPTLVKDRIGKVHFVSDPGAATAIVGGGRGGERDANKPPGNMITRALGVVSQDQERRNNVDSGESRFMLKTNRMGQTSRRCTEEKEQGTNTADRVTIDGSGGGADEHLEGNTKDCGISASSQDLVGCPESPKIGASQQLSTNAKGPIGVVDNGSTPTNKNPSRWAPKKKDMSMSTIHLKQQRNKEQRNKECKHSRYMDSPPGSPPCGWDHNISSAGGRTTQLGDIVFHDHFLEGSWMNSQPSEPIGAGNKPYCLTNNPKEKSISSMPHSLSTSLDEEVVMVIDTMNHRDESTQSIQALHDQYHQISQSNEWETSFERPISSTSAKNIISGDIATNQGRYNCKDTEAINASYCDYQSWSSGSSSVVPGDASHEFEPCLLSRGIAGIDAGAQKFGGVSQSAEKSDLQTCLPTSVPFTNETDKMSQHGIDSLMFDIHDDRFFPGHLSLEKTKDLNGFQTTKSMTSSPLLKNSTKKAVGESFDFDEELNSCEEPSSSLQDRTYGLKTSSDFSKFTMDTVKSPNKSETFLASWQVDSDEQGSCQISSRATQKVVAQEPEVPPKPTGRPDEDLDLLYDPTLDCYYDPKTDRYYELK